jgi:outer membrane lipoprotein SlyB
VRQPPDLRINLHSTVNQEQRAMNMRWSLVGSIVLLGAVLVAGEANAQTSVTYGRITAVRQVNIQNQNAQAAGTIVGGALGVASGSGQSSSNRALRGLGGAAVGNRLAGAAGSSTGFEYTVLIGGTNTIRMVTEQAGLRVGDCVSVERGQFNNIRLADDARCAAPASAPARATTPAPANAPARASAPVPASAQAEADACVAAKQQLLNATTDAEFDLAERRMRLLCGD